MIGAPTALTTLHRPATMMQQLSSQLFQLSAWDKQLFVNAVEELDKNLMHASSVVQNSSRQVLGERLINSMHYMVTNQKSHQDNGTANLRQLTSNTCPLLPKPTLWFHISWGNLIIMTLTMVILIQTFQLTLAMNPLHIQTPLLSNKLMIMKLITSWNSSTQNMMTIF